MPGFLQDRSGALAAFFGVLTGFSLGWFVFKSPAAANGASASQWPAWISAVAGLCSAFAAVWMAVHSDKLQSQARSIEQNRAEFGRKAAVGVLKNALYMDMNWVVDVSKAYALKGGGHAKVENLLRKGVCFKLGTTSAEKYYTDLPSKVAAPLVEGWVYQKFVGDSYSRWKRTGDAGDLRYLVHRIEKYGETILSPSIWILEQANSKIPGDWRTWKKLTNVDDLRTPR